jgi:hypothetical protein
MSATPIKYTGAPDAVCPITLSPIHDLIHPAIIISTPTQPYELESLWKWILLSKRHPLSGETCCLCDIAALELPWNDGQQTENLLEEMWTNFQETQV